MMTRHWRFLGLSSFGKAVRSLMWKGDTPQAGHGVYQKQLHPMGGCFMFPIWGIRRWRRIARVSACRVRIMLAESRNSVVQQTANFRPSEPDQSSFHVLPGIGDGISLR